MRLRYVQRQSSPRPPLVLWMWMLAVAAAGGAGQRALAQPEGSHKAPTVVSGGAAPGVAGAFAALDPDDPAVKAYAAAQKVRKEKEREIRVLRSKHFQTRHVETRQAGISRLREYEDPALFPVLLEVFKYDENDVRGALLDHFMDQQTDEADATLAWAAVHNPDKWVREEASKRLEQRVKETGGTSTRVKTVIADALASPDNPTAIAGAGLVGKLGLIEAIPALIQAQVFMGNDTGDESGDTSLAYILVGTQQAFVADLEPVVGDGAVGFDPELGVVTNGVYLRIIDAVVVTYRVEIHRTLVDMSSRAWGRSTASLGYDRNKWREWYVTEFKPAMAERAAAEREAAAKAEAQADTGASASPRK